MSGRYPEIVYTWKKACVKGCRLRTPTSPLNLPKQNPKSFAPKGLVEANRIIAELRCGKADIGTL